MQPNKLKPAGKITYSHRPALQLYSGDLTEGADSQLRGTLPDGTTVVLVSAADGVRELCKKVSVVDYGSNQLDTRTADQSLAGILSGYRVPVQIIGVDCIGYWANKQ